MTDEIIFKEPTEPDEKYRINQMTTDSIGVCLIALSTISTGSDVYSAIPYNEIKNSGFKANDMVTLTHVRGTNGEIKVYPCQDDGIKYPLIQTISGCSPNVASLESWRNLKRSQTRFKL